VSPFGSTPEIENAFRQAAEDMGTMDYTPYLLIRGWEFHAHAGQPGLDYVRDPLTNQMTLNLIAVSRQLIRDGINEDNEFTRNARYVTRLPEPLLTEVKAYRERQTAAGLPNYRRVVEIQLPEPIVFNEPESELTTTANPTGDYYVMPVPANPLDEIDAWLQGAPPQVATPLPRPPILVGEGVLLPQRRKKKAKPAEEPKPIKTDRSPLNRNFNFEDRE
jgi:hypothetical protein